uniref:Receptor-like serine/threonine-protein kinase n=1 Tax=Oryza glumipatula TaxID=40148 RepID=A0A0D9Y5E8_9ORYZ
MACSFLCKPWLPLTESAKPARSPAPSSRARTVVQQLAVLLLLLGGVGGGCGALLAAAASTTDTILPGESITGNQTLVSKNGEFELGFFNPGVGIHYFLGVRLRKLAAYSPTFWIGDRVYVVDLPRAALELFGDSLYIKEDGASLWWSSPSSSSSSSGGGRGGGAAVAVLLDTGDLVVRDQRNSSLVLWRSFDYPGDALLPGGRLGLDVATGENVSLTFEGFTHNGSLRADASRRNGFVLTTDGRDTRGAFPDWMVTTQDNGGSLVLNHPDATNSTEFLQLKVGQVSLVRWSGADAGWVPRWTFPSGCKSGGGFFCGDFGVCTTATGGECRCVDGFAPSDTKEWGLGYFVTGCSRSLPLSCDANGQTEHGDSFAILDNLQGLPYNAQDEPATTDEDCREACLNKCYCVAYSTETGCKLWYYDLYNLSSADKPPYSKIYVRLGSKLKSKRGLATRWMVLLVVGSVAVASAMLAVLLLCRYRRDLFGSSKFVVEGSLVVYSYAQIKKATENFSDKLGEGGFGSVFRGTLPGSTTVVAVKNLKGLGYAEKQFRAEVQTVGMIRHTNLVRLLGFCVKGNRKLLVYEYMPNGSLDAHIFSQKSSPLSWQVRYQIAIGIARGLAYLHEECEHCIIHCDIKPENILLDEEFRPKIADFGMAKLLGREFNAALTTIRGTRGYLAPEWLYGQPITKKADVYSFGIVLFEMISGIRSTVTMKFGSHRYYPSYAAAQMHEGNVLCLLDSRLEGNANVEELDITCRVACWCIQDREGDRPSMGHVVRMLEGVVDTEMPPIPASFQNLVDGDDSDIYEENWRLRTQD